MYLNTCSKLHTSLTLSTKCTSPIVSTESGTTILPVKPEVEKALHLFLLGLHLKSTLVKSQLEENAYSPIHEYYFLIYTLISLSKKTCCTYFYYRACHCIHPGITISIIILHYKNPLLQLTWSISEILHSNYCLFHFCCHFRFWFSNFTNIFFCHDLSIPKQLIEPTL